MRAVSTCSAAGSDVRNRRLADALGIAVVGVDYRLAPEQTWPAAPDDCEAAGLWLAENAESRFGTSRLAIGGFSAGATLAVATLLRLRDGGISAFSAGVLQFGTYDLAAQTPAGRLIADEYFLDAYAGTATDRTHPDLSPLFAKLAGLPPPPRGYPRIPLGDDPADWPPPPRWDGWYAHAWDAASDPPLPPGVTAVTGSAWRHGPG